VDHPVQRRLRNHRSDDLPSQPQYSDLLVTLRCVSPITLTTILTAPVGLLTSNCSNLFKFGAEATANGRLETCASTIIAIPPSIIYEVQSVRRTATLSALEKGGKLVPVVPCIWLSRQSGQVTVRWRHLANSYGPSDGQAIKGCPGPKNLGCRRSPIPLGSTATSPQHRIPHLFVS